MMNDNRKQILIEDHNPQWAQNFTHLSEVYLKYLDDLSISVEHVGSTAVPGLCAKPVIDIDIVIDSVSELERIIPVLTDLGYLYLGEVGVPDRFVLKQISNAVPLDGTGRSWQKHHLYCCIKGSTALENHLIFRDNLMRDISLANSYTELKLALAKSASNMDEYVRGKTAFITGVLATNGMSDEDISAVIKHNDAVIPR